MQGGQPQSVRPDELERRIRERLDGLGPLGRHALLKFLLLPDSERAAQIGKIWSHPEGAATAELLIDCEEDRTLRAVLVGMLREMTASIRDRADRCELSAVASSEQGLDLSDRGRGDRDRVR